MFSAPGRSALPAVRNVPCAAGASSDEIRALTPRTCICNSPHTNEIKKKYWPTLTERVEHSAKRYALDRRPEYLAGWSTQIRHLLTLGFMLESSSTCLLNPEYALSLPCLLSDGAKCKQLRVCYVFALKGFIVHARKMRLQRDATGARSQKC